MGSRTRTRSTALAGILLAALFTLASPALAGTLSVTLDDDTLCRANSGSGFGSLANCSGFNGTLSFSHGHQGNAHSAAVVGNGTAAATVRLDSGVFVDTADHPARQTLEQSLWYDFTLAIDVLPGQGWEVTFDQAARGLFAIVNETPAGASDGATSESIRFDINQDIDVLITGFGFYDIDLDFTTFGGPATGSREFSGSRSDLLTGTDDAVLSGSIRTALTANSSCLNSSGPCTNGPEAAVLYGSDGVGGASPASVDDYATWGRSLEPDGYTATFSLVTVPEPTTAGLLAAGLTGLAARRVVRIRVKTAVRREGRGEWQGAPARGVVRALAARRSAEVIR